MTETVAPDSIGDRNPGYGTSKLRLFRLTVQSDNMSMTWWDVGTRNAFDTMARLVRDVTKLMVRKEIKRADIMQEVFLCSHKTDAVGQQVCDLLNNVHPHCTWSRFTIEDGRIQSYMRRTTLHGTELECNVLEHVPSPTAEYAGWYKWLLDNPPLHSLCITAPTISIWNDALRKSNVSIPRRMSNWLFRIVHHKHVQ